MPFEAVPPPYTVDTKKTSTTSTSSPKSLQIPKGEWSHSMPTFSSSNSQSDGYHHLKRIEFGLMGKSYKFNINPEQYTQSEPSRAQVVQTKGGGWVDDFGAGVVFISMKGTTGFKQRTGKNTYGFEKFKQLRDLIRLYYFNSAPGTEITQDKELVFHNYTDGEHWIVVPKTFNLLRSVSRPLLYLYDIQLYGVRPANQPYSKSSPPIKPTLPRV